MGSLWASLYDITVSNRQTNNKIFWVLTVFVCRANRYISEGELRQCKNTYLSGSYDVESLTLCFWCLCVCVCLCHFNMPLQHYDIHSSSLGASLMFSWSNARQNHVCALCRWHECVTPGNELCHKYLVSVLRVPLSELRLAPWTQLQFQPLSIIPAPAQTVAGAAPAAVWRRTEAGPRGSMRAGEPGSDGLCGLR